MNLQNHSNWSENSEYCCSWTLAIEKFSQCLPDSCWVSNILCPSLCCSVILRSSLTRFLISLTMLITHVVVSAAYTIDGMDSGDLHISRFTQAPPLPLKSSKSTLYSRPCPAVSLVEISLLISQCPCVSVSLVQPASQGVLRITKQHYR